MSDEGAALGHPTFWNERYAQAADNSKPTHEWFRDFASLKPYFSRHLFSTWPVENKPRILHLGSGDSTIPYDLLEHGYEGQTCLDFSSTVVELMKCRYASNKGVAWLVGDVRNMEQIASKSIDVAFDKGTLDAMIFGSPWNPPDEVLDNSGRYMKEDAGVFLYITYRQPHFVKPILNRASEWDLEMEVLGGGDSFEYYGYILRKGNYRDA